MDKKESGKTQYVQLSLFDWAKARELFEKPSTTLPNNGEQNETTPDPDPKSEL